MSPDVVRVQRRLRKLSDELDGAAMAKRLKRLGVQAQRDADEALRSTPAARGTLSDGSMSGWHRGRPVLLATRVTVRRDGSGVLVTPDRTAGLWRVLESGRRAASKGDRVARGTTKAGAVRYRRVKRNTGATEGKGTWTRAETLMARRTPGRMRTEIARAFRSTFPT